MAQWVESGHSPGNPVLGGCLLRPHWDGLPKHHWAKGWWNSGTMLYLLSDYSFILLEFEMHSRFNRWCMRGRSLTMPLAYATTNNFCFGTSTAVAASTNWTKSLKQSLYSAMRGRPYLRSECTMHTSSKVRILLLIFSLFPLNIRWRDTVLRLFPLWLRVGTNACRVNNGGCSSLCLAIPNGRSCACADDQILDGNNVTCRGT